MISLGSAFEGYPVFDPPAALKCSPRMPVIDAHPLRRSLTPYHPELMVNVAIAKEYRPLIRPLLLSTYAIYLAR